MGTDNYKIIKRYRLNDLRLITAVVRNECPNPLWNKYYPKGDIRHKGHCWKGLPAVQTPERLGLSRCRGCGISRPELARLKRKIRKNKCK